MRKGLKSIEGQRLRVKARFVRYGSKRAYKGEPLTTCLFESVADAKTGRPLADHIWITQGKQLARLSLREGDIVAFDARVTEYVKGYMGRRDDVWDAPIETDYRLSHQTKFEIMSEIPK